MNYQQAAFEDLRKKAQCFNKLGQIVPYQQALNLFKKMQKSSSNLESEVG